MDSQAKADIWMPLYIADYLAETTRLSTEQHGAYLLLMMDYWRNGALPDDDAALANITKYSAFSWKKNRQVFEKLFSIENGEWHHKKLDVQIAKAVEMSKKNKDKAQNAANKRWNNLRESLKNNDATSIATSIATSDAQTMLGSCPSQSQSQDINKEAKASVICKQTTDDRSAQICSAIIDLYHELMPNNPRCKVINTARRKTIVARWKEAAKMDCQPFGYDNKDDGLIAWRQFFSVCAESEFLTGRTQPLPGRPPFIADIDFLLSPNGFIKCLENKYHRG